MAVVGGGAADTFVFQPDDSGVGTGNRDFVADFSKAQNDEINLSEFGGLQFIGQAAFSAAGQVRFTQSGGDTIVSGDVNGDGVADFSILLTGAKTLVAGDFVL